jgi:hypothetical protein
VWSSLGPPVRVPCQGCHTAHHSSLTMTMCTRWKVGKAHAIDPERENGPVIVIIIIIILCQLCGAQVLYDGERPAENPAPIYLGHVATVSLGCYNGLMIVNDQFIIPLCKAYPPISPWRRTSGGATWVTAVACSPPAALLSFRATSRTPRKTTALR